MKKLSRALLDFRTKVIDILEDCKEDELECLATTLEEIIEEELRARLNDIRYGEED